MKVGVQLHPQHTTIELLRDAWQRADRMGVDSIWTWDHFFPLYGEADGPHFEGWTLLSAMAVDTARAQIGILVTCNSYRNPNLLADMARTVDHLSDGRTVLGLGAGWFERDYDEYGYEFGTPGERLRALETSLETIKQRLPKLVPPVKGRLPVMIGGGGEKVTLRIVARYADMWNGFGPPEVFDRKNSILTEWCEKLDRNPEDVERTVLIGPDEAGRVGDYERAGAQHVIVRLGHPFDLTSVEGILKVARG